LKDQRKIRKKKDELSHFREQRYFNFAHTNHYDFSGTNPNSFIWRRKISLLHKKIHTTPFLLHKLEGFWKEEKWRNNIIFPHQESYCRGWMKECTPPNRYQFAQTHQHPPIKLKTKHSIYNQQFQNREKGINNDRNNTTIIEGRYRDLLSSHKCR